MSQKDYCENSLHPQCCILHDGKRFRLNRERSRRFNLPFASGSGSGVHLPHITKNLPNVWLVEVGCLDWGTSQRCLNILFNDTLRLKIFNEHESFGPRGSIYTKRKRKEERSTRMKSTAGREDNEKYWVDEVTETD